MWSPALWGPDLRLTGLGVTSEWCWFWASHPETLLTLSCLTSCIFLTCYIFLINFKRSFKYLISLIAQLVKNPPAMQETWVRSLGWEDPLEKEKATHSSTLAWRIPWTVKSVGSQRVRHDWEAFTFSSIHVASLISIPLNPTLCASGSLPLLQQNCKRHPNSWPDQELSSLHGALPPSWEPYWTHSSAILSRWHHGFRARNSYPVSSLDCNLPEDRHHSLVYL